MKSFTMAVGTRGVLIDKTLAVTLAALHIAVSAAAITIHQSPSSLTVDEHRIIVIHLY
ncbi:hypothetical protein GCM10010965_17710 [Caldalkalibacillus thermarum]|nr:hypothetical protein GCM10010965_17710 [Caldalkalibacillus thermarum]